MSEFNVDAFRAEAKAAGYSDDVIESEIKKYSKNINSATGKEFGTVGEKEIQDQAQKWRDEGNVMPGTKTPEDKRSTGEQLSQWFGTPEGTAVAGLLAGAGAATGLNYWNSLRDRKQNQPDNFKAPKIEPVFGREEFLKPTVSAGEPVVTAPAAAVEAAPKPTGPVPAPTFPVSAQQQPAIAGYGQQTMNAPTGVPAPVAPAEPAAPAISPKDQAAIDLANAKREAVLADIRRKDELHAKTLAGEVKSDLAKEQKNNGAAGRPGSKQEAEKQMTKSSTIAEEDKAAFAALKAESKKVPGAVAPQPLPTTGALTTGSGMPAYAGKGPAEGKLRSEFASIGDVPQGLVFIPGAHQMDTLRNGVGQENYKTIIKEKGRYPINENEARDWIKEFANKEGAPMGREERIAKGLPPNENVSGIGKKVNKKRLIKVGGIGGALIAAADIANAQSPKEAAQTIGEMLLPLGITPSELESGKLTKKQLKAFEEAQKLGSPYRSVPPPRR